MSAINKAALSAANTESGPSEKNLGCIINSSVSRMAEKVK